jgi:hypothetical protein
MPLRTASYETQTSGAVMIDRQYGQIVFECDGCDELLHTKIPVEDFNGAMAVFRREGWKAIKIGDEWVHECPNCQKKYDQKERNKEHKK